MAMDNSGTPPRTAPGRSPDDLTGAARLGHRAEPARSTPCRWTSWPHPPCCPDGPEHTWSLTWLSTGRRWHGSSTTWAAVNRWRCTSPTSNATPRSTSSPRRTRRRCGTGCCAATTAVTRRGRRCWSETTGRAGLAGCPVVRPGRPRPSCATRRREVEIHHADLGAAYTRADWPDDFVVELLDVVSVDRADAGPLRLRATDLGRDWIVGERGRPDRGGHGARTSAGG